MAISVLITDDHKVVRQGLKMVLDLDPEVEVVGEEHLRREFGHIRSWMGANLMSSIFMTVNLYAPPPDIVVASSPQIDRIPIEENAKALNIQDPAYELLRRPLP